MGTIVKSKNTLFRLFSHGMLIIFGISCLLPLLVIISTSLSSEDAVTRNGYSLIPRQFSFTAYEYIFLNARKLLHAYFISISTGVTGTVLALLLNAMIAYPLSRKDFRHRGTLSFYVFFTMLFSGGLVPWYIVIITLHMKDTFWALVVPYLVAAWYILILKTFFQTIQVEIIESAKMDGASEWGIYFRMMIPLSKPALTTVGLLIVFQYWSDYWLGLLFISNDNLVNLQYLFFKITSNLDFYARNADRLPRGLTLDALPKQSSKMVLCVLIAVPMLLVFPFFQKYFVNGLTVGSVKG